MVSAQITNSQLIAISVTSRTWMNERTNERNAQQNDIQLYFLSYVSFFSLKEAHIIWCESDKHGFPWVDSNARISQNQTKTHTSIGQYYYTPLLRMHCYLSTELFGNAIFLRYFHFVIATRIMSILVFVFCFVPELTMQQVCNLSELNDV